MLNTLNTDKNTIKLHVENIISGMYLLPKWEKIKSFSFIENSLFFKKNKINVNLYRKFSSKNMVEKYLIKNNNNVELANMDLKIYKDCVYIINLNFKNNSNINEILTYLIQTAVEKTLYNTTNQELKINLTFPSLTNLKIRKFLLTNEFLQEENQSDYEKEMFGETFIFKMNKFSIWKSKIKHNPILLNK